MIRILANENFPRLSSQLLRAAGLDVAAIAETLPGAQDEEVLSRGVAENRIVITFDRDYGDLIYRRRLPCPPGLVYLRFAPLTPTEPAEILLRVIALQIDFQGWFSVLDRERLRQRPLP